MSKLTEPILNPFNKGDVVRIPVGLEYRRGWERLVTKKSYTVEILGVLKAHYRMVDGSLLSVPFSISWSGSGGYRSEAYLPHDVIEEMGGKLVVDERQRELFKHHIERRERNLCPRCS